MSLTASTTLGAATLPIVRTGDQCRKQFKTVVSVPAGLQPLGMQSQLIINNRRRLICPVQGKRASMICASAVNVRCGESQTQGSSGQTATITRESSTITVAPGKEKSPDLDDGGAGFPPRDDDDGGGGGGGGGGNWSGGFFFFGFLAFLGFLNEQKDDDANKRRRR